MHQDLRLIHFALPGGKIGFMESRIARPNAIKLFFTFIYILIFPALILILAGDWLWIEGCIFNIWFIALCTTVIIYLYIRDPALLMERYKQPGAANQKGWDKYVVIGLVLGFTLWIVIMPLDARRFIWSVGFPVWAKVMGGIFLLLSSYLFYRSYRDNTFVSGLVRIQTERKQTVVTTGAYGFVRHPMYLGGILLFFGAPLLMGSLYGLLISFLLTLLIAGRIIGEEKMLVKGLQGYAEYRKKVKYRLLPFIW